MFRFWGATSPRRLKNFQIELASHTFTANADNSVDVNVEYTWSVGAFDTQNYMKKSVSLWADQMPVSNVAAKDEGGNALPINVTYTSDDIFSKIAWVKINFLSPVKGPATHKLFLSFHVANGICVYNTNRFVPAFWVTKWKNTPIHEMVNTITPSAGACTFDRPAPGNTDLITCPKASITTTDNHDFVGFQLPTTATMPALTCAENMWNPPQGYAVNAENENVPSSLMVPLIVGIFGVCPLCIAFLCGIYCCKGEGTGGYSLAGPGGGF